MTLRDWAWMALIGLLLTGLAMTSVLVLPGCGGTRAIARALAPPPAEQPADQSGSLTDQLTAEHDKRDAADIRIKSLEKRLAVQEDQHTSRQLLWLAMVCLIGFGGAVAAFVWLPVGKKVALGFAVMFIAVGVVALVTRTLIQYLPWIALGLVAFLGIALLFSARKILAALIHAVDFGVDMTAAETVKDAEMVKVEHTQQQIRAGVHGLITATLNKAKANA